LLDESKIALVDNTPNTETFTLQTSITSAEGEVPDHAFRAVVCGFNDRLDKGGKDTSDVVVWLKNEGSLEGEGISASARVAQMLGWT